MIEYTPLHTTDFTSILIRKTQTHVNHFTKVNESAVLQCKHRKRYDKKTMPTHYLVCWLNNSIHSSEIFVETFKWFKRRRHSQRVDVDLIVKNWKVCSWNWRQLLVTSILKQEINISWYPEKIQGDCIFFDRMWYITRNIIEVYDIFFVQFAISVS